MLKFAFDSEYLNNYQLSHRGILVKIINIISVEPLLEDKVIFSGLPIYKILKYN